MPHPVAWARLLNLTLALALFGSNHASGAGPASDGKGDLPASEATARAIVADAGGSKFKNDEPRKATFGQYVWHLPSGPRRLLHSASDVAVVNDIPGHFEVLAGVLVVLNQLGVNPEVYFTGRCTRGMVVARHGCHNDGHMAHVSFGVRRGQPLETPCRPQSHSDTTHHPLHVAWRCVEVCAHARFVCGMQATRRRSTPPASWSG